METKKVWIASYAMTKGVIEAFASKNISSWGIYYKIKEGDRYDRHARPGSYALTKEGAYQIAEEMRLRKIESLKKQIAKLEKMSFISGETK